VQINGLIKIVPLRGFFFKPLLNPNRHVLGEHRSKAPKPIPTVGFRILGDLTTFVQRDNYLS
jgi:hypothetical protein